MTSIDNLDYWSLLGLTPESDQDQLKRAFRREARKWHPDLNVNDIHAEERFKLINEAYAVLSDPRKRIEWENSNKFNYTNQDPFLEEFPPFETYLDVVLGVRSVSTDQIQQELPDEEASEYLDQNEGDFYTDFEREWPTPSTTSPPPVQVQDDLESLVELTPDEALFGTNVELELTDNKIVEVQTPPLAGDGWRLRLAGVAPGGKDHFIQLRVQTDEGLRIDGLRVLYRLELLPHEAVLGCAIDIPTLSGTVTLQVPPRSSSGRLLRLKGRGIEYDGRTGDQFVEIAIITPKDLSDAEEALYRRLEEISDEKEEL